VDDVLRVKELVASALAQAPASGARGPLVYGAMVETPAAVEMVTELAREVDFFSIGTNDLIQYTLVVDREDPRMSSERHAYHPAILRMIRRVVDRAHGAGRHVSVCGEMAARPDLAVALVAMGVDALSVTPRVIPELKQAFARVALGPLRASIEGVLAASSLEEVERALRKYVRDSEAPPAADARG
jgi:phosphoenolpyruvate-protein kinase (PTS system EI component)